MFWSFGADGAERPVIPTCFLTWDSYFDIYYTKEFSKNIDWRTLHLDLAVPLCTYAPIAKLRYGNLCYAQWGALPGTEHTTLAKRDKSGARQEAKLYSKCSMHFSNGIPGCHGNMSCSDKMVAWKCRISTPWYTIHGSVMVGQQPGRSVFSWLERVWKKSRKWIKLPGFEIRHPKCTLLAKADAICRASFWGRCLVQPKWWSQRGNSNDWRVISALTCIIVYPCIYASSKTYVYHWWRNNIIKVKDSQQEDAHTQHIFSTAQRVGDRAPACLELHSHGI